MWILASRDRVACIYPFYPRAQNLYLHQSPFLRSEGSAFLSHRGCVDHFLCVHEDSYLSGSHLCTFNCWDPVVVSDTFKSKLATRCLSSIPNHRAIQLRASASSVSVKSRSRSRRLPDRNGNQISSGHGPLRKARIYPAVPGLDRSRYP